MMVGSTPLRSVPASRALLCCPSAGFPLKSTSLVPHVRHDPLGRPVALHQLAQHGARHQVLARGVQCWLQHQVGVLEGSLDVPDTERGSTQVVSGREGVLNAEVCPAVTSGHHGGYVLLSQVTAAL